MYNKVMKTYNKNKKNNNYSNTMKKKNTSYSQYNDNKRRHTIVALITIKQEHGGKRKAKIMRNIGLTMHQPKRRQGKIRI